MIEAKNLTMVYGNGNKATDDISFNIKAGEIVGFAGPNGAGKTTVIKMLAGILKPTSGTAVINGHDINKEPIKAKMSFAYIADNPDILIQLTGLEYLNFIADMYEVKEDVRKEKIKVLSERFGMKDVLNTQMREYSHGMRQKLMVISALIHDPQLYQIHALPHVAQPGLRGHHGVDAGGLIRQDLRDGPGCRPVLIGTGEIVQQIPQGADAQPGERFGPLLAHALDVSDVRIQIRHEIPPFPVSRKAPPTGRKAPPALRPARLFSPPAP